MTVPRAEYEDDKEQEVRGVRAAPTRLDRAKEFCASRESLQIHPLRNTHTNDVPVVMAEFARLEVESTQILDDDSLEMKARLRARSAKLESQLTESKAACDRADEVIVGLEARNTELEADNEAFDSLNDKLRQKVSDADEVIAGLENQLPEGMEDCIIEFHECSKGHGRLIATNWVYFDCLVCKLKAAKQKVKAAVDEVARS